MIEMFTPPKTNMEPKKGTISIGNTSSNHHFSGDMLVFRGGTPPKTNMEPENDDLEDVFSFSNG